MRELRAHQLRIVELEHKFAGIKRLFDAATMRNDGTESEQLRAQLHALLDHQLDYAALCILLTKTYIENQGLSDS